MQGGGKPAGVVHPGSRYITSITLSNDGPFDVTVLSIGVSAGQTPCLKVVGVMMAPTTGPSLQWARFRPFTLHPNDYVDVRVVTEVHACLTASEKLGPVGVPVALRGPLLPFVRHTVVLGDATIQLVRDAAVPCR
jgi:hypothetical protein